MSGKAKNGSKHIFAHVLHITFLFIYFYLFQSPALNVIYDFYDFNSEQMHLLRQFLQLPCIQHIETLKGCT